MFFTHLAKEKVVPLSEVPDPTFSEKTWGTDLQ